MKAKELAGYLREHPDWGIEFYFYQYPDEIDDTHIRKFTIMDVGENPEHKITVLIGIENG